MEESVESGKWTWIPAVVCVVAIFAAVFFATRERDWSPGGARGPFGRGRRAVTEARYTDAIPELEQYLRDYPAGRNAGRARLFLGKARLGLDELDAAREQFEAVLRDYPESLEAHKSRYKLGLVALLRGNSEEALAVFSKMADEPDGPLAPEAQAMRRYLTSRQAGSASAER
jgi:TolA-binding protein